LSTVGGVRSSNLILEASEQRLPYSYTWWPICYWVHLTIALLSSKPLTSIPQVLDYHSARARAAMYVNDQIDMTHLTSSTYGLNFFHSSLMACTCILNNVMAFSLFANYIVNVNSTSYCIFHMTLPNQFCTFISHHSSKPGVAASVNITLLLWGNPRWQLKMTNFSLF
jgi:hypothetical protein